MAASDVDFDINTARRNLDGTLDSNHLDGLKPPVAPYNLRELAVEETQFIVGYDHDGPADGFEILDENDEVVIPKQGSPLPSTAREYTMENLNAGATYVTKVRAFGDVDD